MATTQVKFYKMTESQYSGLASKNEGALYFVDNGELYRGTQRFGLGRVTVSEATASIEGAARGDIVVTGSGAGWIFDGTNWQSIGGDVGSLTSAWRADISASLSGLAVGGEGSYITGITQGADGSVTANAVAFPTLDTGDNDGEVKLGSDAAKVSGWDTVKTDISNLQAVVSYSGDGDSVVTATTGNFTNLNVSDTATFSATTISATSLTISGSTVEQLADKQIASIAASTVVSASNGITVSVTTQGGSVTAVALNAEAFGNVMSFKGVVTELPSESNVSGDIVVIGADPTGQGLVQGQEYIYDGTNWELIGDQNTYAVNAYSSSATVFTGVETVPGALNAAGAAIDALKEMTNAYVGGTSTSADQGVSVTVAVDVSTMAPTVTTTVASATLFAGLDASVSSSENNSITVGVTQVDGVVTGVTADLLWLGADGNPIDGGTSEHADTWYKYAGDTEWRTVSITGAISRSSIPIVANVVELEIGSDVTSIGDSEFSDLEGLASVTIPDSVTSIGYYAFGDCYGLTSVTFLGKTLEQVQEMANYSWGINTSIINVA